MPNLPERNQKPLTFAELAASASALPSNIWKVLDTIHRLMKASGVKTLCITLKMLVLLVACALRCPVSSATITKASVQTLPFAIYWPLVDLETVGSTNSTPLLRGTLEICARRLQDTGSVLTLRVLLTRPNQETNRLHWNKSLAFPQYDWMRYVRAWDKEQQWLWPNLPFLLRAHGTERVQRYGGWDPGKDVDNDFAAVLIRKYDATGQVESADTRNRPLVSAEWHPVGSTGADKQTIVHTASSDEFTIHLSEQAGANSGRLLVWLIYADFMGAPVPKTWPKEPEFNGGILGFFQVDWQPTPDHKFTLQTTQQTPRISTAFDWRRWLGRPSPQDDVRATARLTDR